MPSHTPAERKKRAIEKRKSFLGRGGSMFQGLPDKFSTLDKPRSKRRSSKKR